MTEIGSAPTTLHRKQASVPEQRVTVGDAITLPGLGDGSSDLDIHLAADPESIIKLDILRSRNREECTTITIDWAKCSISLDCTHSFLTPTDSTPLSGEIEILDEIVQLRTMCRSSGWSRRLARWAGSSPML